MNKSNLMSVILGLVVGLVIGFVGANSINKSAYEKQPAPVSSATGAPNGNPALPPDHPPLGTISGEAPNKPSAPRPEVMAAIDKAKAQPQNYEAQMTAADLYYQIERFDDAAKFYETAAKLKPSESEPMIKAGNAYQDGEKYEEAEKWYLKALEKEPKNVNVRSDLGLTFFLREPPNIDRAIKEYKTSLTIEPNHEITLQNLAVAYRKKNDTENLNATLERLKKINPKNPAVTMSDDK
jgi:tetratricopeptide (TPR) repeat protein